MLPNEEHPVYRAFLDAPSCGSRIQFIKDAFEDLCDLVHIAKEKLKEGKPVWTPFVAEMYEDYTHLLWMIGGYHQMFVDEFPNCHPSQSYIARWQEDHEYTFDDLEEFIAIQMNGVYCWMWCAAERILRTAFAESLRTFKRTRRVKEQILQGGLSEGVQPQSGSVATIRTIQPQSGAAPSLSEGARPSLVT